MKYENLSENDIDFTDFYNDAYSIWKDLLGEQKADELCDEIEGFHKKLWNE